MDRVSDRWQRAVVAFAVLVMSALAVAQSANAVGAWDLQSDAQGQITKFTLTITKEGETFKGKAESEAYGAEALTDLKVENNIVTYTRNLSVGGQSIPMTFKGTIVGDKMTGAYSVMGQDLPVTGTRKTAAAATK